jgi:hypothetical protein
MSSVSAAIQSPKTAQIVAGTTIGSGTLTVLEWIPANIGTIASIVGIILSTVLIYVNLKQHFLKMKILQKELEETKKL